jgi:hypothetical protein
MKKEELMFVVKKGEELMHFLYREDRHNIHRIYVKKLINGKLEIWFVTTIGKQTKTTIVDKKFTPEEFKIMKASYNDEGFKDYSIDTIKMFTKHVDIVEGNGWNRYIG